MRQALATAAVFACYAIIVPVMALAYGMCGVLDRLQEKREIMKIQRVGFLLFLLAVAMWAQDANFAAAGATYNPSAPNAVAGTALYAKAIPGAEGTFAITVMDAVPSSVRPFLVVTNVAVGIAQKVVTVGKVAIYAPTAAGVSWNGSSPGWTWSTGALAAISVRGTRVMPNVRAIKSSVSNYSGYQVMVGVLIGRGF